MLQTPPVTWLLPVRNGMPYLTATLHSIAHQTYRNHKIIAWDNGSGDGTVDELHRWIPSKIPGVVISNRPRRLGPSLAAMVEMADTELCARMDGDDLNVLDRLEQQVSFLQSHPSVGVLGGQLELIDEHDRKIDDDTWGYPARDADIRWTLRWRNQLAHNAVLFRRSVILAAGNYRDYQPYEDFDLWQRAANHTEMRNFPHVLVRYRRITSSSTGAVKSFVPTDRATAMLNASILFPGLTQVDRVMSLWEATHPLQLHLPSKFQYIRQLEKAARLLAEKVGKPANYFTETTTYKDQYFYLRRSFFKRMGLMPLVRLKERVRGVRLPD